MSIRTGFVFDESGLYSIDDEVALAVDELCVLGLDVEVSAQGHTMMDIYKESFDLLVIDYGGLGVMGGSHANSQVWAACQYAGNHPGSLVVLWTKYTANLYWDGLDETFSHLDNIVIRFERHESAYAFSEDVFRGKIQRWFGVGQKGVKRNENHP